MKVIGIIPSRRWKNARTGVTASIYGSLPYVNEAQKAEWSIVQVGFTWQMDNGTVGLGRVPAKTMEEAVQVMDQVNARG